MALWKKNALLLLVAAVICAASFLLNPNTGFDGTDNQAAEVISELAPGHNPWAKPTVKPNETMESFLFTLQAVIGAGVAGFALGRISAGRSRENGEKHVGD